MTRKKMIAFFLLAILGLATFCAAQKGMRRWQRYEVEMQDPVGDPADAWDKTEFAFARLRYPSYNFGGGFFQRSSWGTDSNKAERQFVQGVKRLSRINVRSVEEIIEADSDEM